jgi:predicted TIM-barrel fold metal-dependent hydrolase
MILTTPKVLEMLERLGIPVFIELSIYESHPMGRRSGSALRRHAGPEERPIGLSLAQAAVLDVVLEDFEHGKDRGVLPT